MLATFRFSSLFLISLWLLPTLFGQGGTPPLQLQVGAPSTASFSLEPGVDDGVQFSFDVTLVGDDLSNGVLLWRWQDAASGLYWTGSTWAASAGWGNAAFAAPPLETTVTSGQVSVAIDTPLLATAFWNGNRSVEIHLKWRENGTAQEVAGDQTVDLTFNWNHHHAPANLSPTGTVHLANQPFTWDEVPGATGYRLKAFPVGGFNATQFAAGYGFNYPPANITLPANQTRELWIATENANGYGPPQKAGEVMYVPPTAQYGAPVQASMTIDFNSSQRHQVTVPYTITNLPNGFDPQWLQWTFRTQINGQPHYYGSNFGNWGWYTDPEFNSMGRGQATITQSQLELQLGQQDLPDDFWHASGDPFAGYVNRYVTLELRYAEPGLGVITFSGTEPQIDFLRGGAAPAAPTAMTSPGSETGNVWPLFDWDTVPNARRYGFEVEGPFGSNGQIVTYSNQSFGKLLTDSQWQVCCINPPGVTPLPNDPFNFPPGTYTVRVTAENPTASSVAFVTTFERKPAVRLDGFIALDFEVVAGCDQTIDLHYDVLEMAADFDPNRFKLFFRKQEGTTELFWNGSHWTTQKTGFSPGEHPDLDYQITPTGLDLAWRADALNGGFWDGIEIGENLAPSLFAEYNHSDTYGHQYTEDILKDNGFRWVAGFLLKRWQLPEPPPGLTEPSVCYTEESQPSFQWDPVLYADEYYFGIKEEGKDTFLNSDADAPLSSPTYSLSEFHLEADKNYTIYLGSGYKGCRSDMVPVLEQFNYLPEYMSHDAYFDDLTPTQAYEWQTFEESLGASPELRSFSVTIDPLTSVDEIGYFVDCDDVEVVKTLEFRIKEQGGSNQVYIGFAKIALPVRADDALTTVDGDYPPFRYHLNMVDFHRDDLRNQFDAYFDPDDEGIDWVSVLQQAYNECGGPECDFVGWPHIQSQLEIRDTATGTTLRRFANVDSFNYIPVRFLPDSRVLTSLTLEDPDPAFDTVEPEPANYCGGSVPDRLEQARTTMAFSYEVSDPNNPPIVDSHRFRWRVTSQDDGAVMVWNGDCWVPEAECALGFPMVTLTQEELVDEHGDPLDCSEDLCLNPTAALPPKCCQHAFYRKGALDLGGQTFDLDIPSAMFPSDSFFGYEAGGSLRDSRNLTIQLLYVNKKGLEVEVQSNGVAFTVFRNINLVMNHLELDHVTTVSQAIVPSLPESRYEFQRNFQFQIEKQDGTSVPESDPLFESYEPVPSQFVVLLTTDDDENPLYWNGTDWGSQEFEAGMGDGASHPFFQNFTLDVAAATLRADIPASLFNSAFFGPESAQRNGRLILRYKQNCGNAPATVDTPYLSLIVNLAEDPNLPEWGGPMTFLRTLRVQAESLMRHVYPPEPFWLAGQGPHWIVGRQITHVPGNFPAQPAVGQLSDEEYGWLEINPSSADMDLLGFVVPYNPVIEPQFAELDFAARKPLSLQAGSDLGSEWTFSDNLAYRWFLGPNQEERLVVVFFVPNRDVIEREGFFDVDETLVLDPTGVDTASLLSAVDQRHNRMLTVTRLNDGTGQPTRNLYSVDFTDTLGHLIESRVVGSHGVQGLPPNRFLRSGIQFLDSSSRPLEAVKNFFSTADPNQLAQTLATAGTRQATFDEARQFWQQDRNLAADAGGENWVYAEGDGNPVARTVYENDARSRPLAQHPMGTLSTDPTDLAYGRFHYFFAPAPNLILSYLSLQNPGQVQAVRLHNLPTMVEDQGAQPALLGTLAIDPNGSVSATFTGNDPEVPLISVQNPSIGLMEAWGLQVWDDQVPTDGQLNAEAVFLPPDYTNRIQADSGVAANLVSVQAVDELGRLLASFPPKSLTVNYLGTDWEIKSNNHRLETRHAYDALGRLVRSEEADAGKSRMIYNRLGDLRYSQNAGQAKASTETNQYWHEFHYDDRGRNQSVRAVVLNADPQSHTETCVSPVSLVQNELARIDTHFDTYLSGDQTPGFEARWPVFHEDLAIDTLRRTNGLEDDPEDVIIGDPFGLPTQTIGPFKAVRNYYDHRGRVICTVTLIKGIGEPQILWVQYDARDLLTADYYHNGRTSQAYVYDAMDRLVAVHDRTPKPVRSKLQVARTDGSSATHQAQLLLGPFVQANGPDEPTASRELARYTYTPTGQGGHVSFGDGLFSRRVRFDIRDWVQRAEIRNGSALVLGVDMRYQDGAEPMYDGNISGITETYGDGLLEAGNTHVIDHDYSYDPIYQLSQAASNWIGQGMTTLAYGYDRNGNRTEETRKNLPQNGQLGTSEFTLEHQLAQNSNRLESVTKQPLGGGDLPFMDLTHQGEPAYDAMGNITRIAKFDDLGRETVQDFRYDDPLNPILPTQITQTVWDANGDPLPDQRLDARFTYDSSGARIRSELVAYDENGIPKPADIAHFLPSGTENLAEGDAMGRLGRAYLFAGEERVGYRSQRETALYVKDHLGSTKMTVALAEPAPAENRHPATPGLGLLGTWSFEDQLQDASGYGHGGLALNGVAYGAGIDGRGLELDGSGAAVRIPDSADLDQMNQAFTIMAWVRDTDPHDGVDEDRDIFAKGDTPSSAQSTFRLKLGNSKHLWLTLGDGAQAQAIRYPQVIPHNTWTHVAATYDGQNANIYVDGALVLGPIAVTVGPLVDAGDLMIGRQSQLTCQAPHNACWQGGIDEARAYRRALTEAEIHAEMTQTNGTATFASTSFAERMRLKASDTGPYGLQFREQYAADINPETEAEPHGFTGQEKEPDLGLYYYGARWYSPEIGRFLQVDPAREFYNPYSYVGNNPVSSIDPTGESEEDYTRLLISEHVYGKGGALPTGVFPVSQGDLNLLGLAQVDFEFSGSGFLSGLYFDSNNNEYILAFAGTEFTSILDWIANLDQATGATTSQYQAAINLSGLIQDRINKFGNGATFSLTGHSLGGGLASAGSIVHNIPASTFNAAGLNPTTVARHGRKVSSGKGLIKAFYIKGEILSWFQDGIPGMGFFNAAGTRIPVPPRLVKTPITLKGPPFGRPTEYWNLPPSKIDLHSMSELLKVGAFIRKH